VRAVLDDGVAPPGGVGGQDRRRLWFRRGVGGRLGGQRIGAGGAALPGPVPGAGEQEGEDDGEGQHAAVPQHRQEHPAADQREQHGRQGLAVDAAGEQLAHLVLVLVVVGDEEPGEAVEEEADAAGGGEHREGDAEDDRVHVALPPEPGAHTRQHLVAAVAAEPVGRPGRDGLPGLARVGCTSPVLRARLPGAARGHG
jgi:hypothetical protein